MERRHGRRIIGGGGLDDPVGRMHGRGVLSDASHDAGYGFRKTSIAGILADGGAIGQVGVHVVVIIHAGRRSRGTRCRLIDVCGEAAHRGAAGGNANLRIAPAPAVDVFQLFRSEYRRRAHVLGSAGSGHHPPHEKSDSNQGDAQDHARHENLDEREPADSGFGFME